MKKNLVIITVVILLLMTAAPAFARWSWCASDPEVVLPNGQSVYIWVGVPEENQGATVTLHLVVPEGSRIVNHAGEVNVNWIIDRYHPTGNHIFASVREDIPVELSAYYGEEPMSVFTFEKGKGQAHWHW